MLTHFPEIKEQLTESFSCEVCGKIIKGRDSFKRHTRIHTGEVEKKEVPCPICSKTFARESLLRAHIVIHTGIVFDGAIFYRKSLMFCLFHLHSTEDRPKKYICKLCAKAFHHRSSLFKHKKNSCLLQKPASQCAFCAAILKDKIAQIQGDVTA